MFGWLRAHIQRRRSTNRMADELRNRIGDATDRSTALASAASAAAGEHVISTRESVRQFTALKNTLSSLLLIINR